MLIVFASILLLLPGLLLATAFEPEPEDPASFLATIFILSLAIWISGFWALRFFPWGWLGIIGSLSLFSLGGLLIFFKKVRRAIANLKWSRAHKIVLGAFFLVGVLRFLPYFLVPVPPGADMSMHSYMARLILAAGGVPSDYSPLLPIKEFGSYAAGLPTLAAIISWLAKLPIPQSAFLISCLVHWLVGLAIYSTLRDKYNPLTSLLAALLVTLATRDPQYHFNWGGNPTVLSLIFVIFGLRLLERLSRDDWRRVLFPGALAFSTSVLTHSVIPFALIYIYPPVALYQLWQMQPSFRRQFVLRGAALAGLMLLLMAPYLSQFHLQLQPAEIEWIKNWQRLPVHVPPGPIWLTPLTMFWHLVVRFGAFFGLWLTGLLIARRFIQGRAIVAELLQCAVIFLLVINARLWILPGSYALYPDRLILLFVIPAASICAASIDGLKQKWSVARRWAQTTWAFLFISSLLAGYAIWYLRSVQEVTVTTEDWAAIEWLGAHTPNQAVIENNYWDAGIWIGAIALRPALHPHVNVVYLDDIAAWQKNTRPDYYFIGAKLTKREANTLTAAQFRRRPDLYEEVFRRGEAAVFKVKGDGVKFVK